MSETSEHVGLAAGGPANGKELRSSMNTIKVPVVCEGGFGAAFYDWFNGQWLYRGEPDQ